MADNCHNKTETSTSSIQSQIEENSKRVKKESHFVQPQMSPSDQYHQSLYNKLYSQPRSPKPSARYHYSRGSTVDGSTIPGHRPFVPRDNTFEGKSSLGVGAASRKVSHMAKFAAQLMEKKSSNYTTKDESDLGDMVDVGSEARKSIGPLMKCLQRVQSTSVLRIPKQRQSFWARYVHKYSLVVISLDRNEEWLL